MTETELFDLMHNGWAYPHGIGRADWCPAVGKNVHRFSDYGSREEHRHPKCDWCGYMDESRELPPLRKAIQ